MDMSTTYMGLELPHPLVIGACPLVRDLSMARRLEDAGAAALTMTSLFEEQLTREQMAIASAFERPAESSAEAASYLPLPAGLNLGPDEYLEHLRRLKETLSIPIIGSLNGVTPGGWLRYARMIEDAGADGLELNVYDVATDPDLSGQAIEDRLISLVRDVAGRVTIPLAVKLSPFFTSLPNIAARLSEAGADGLVVFNRFYQPDIDAEQLEVVRINLSSSSELLPRLHALAILSGRVGASLAVTGGVHTHLDVIRSVMAGAHAVQVVSALLRDGPSKLTMLLDHSRAWLEEHEYESLGQMRGSMSLERCPDPHAYQRLNYMQMLHSWNG